MCAVQFDNVSGSGEGIRLCDLIKGDVPFGTQIQILDANGSTYSIYNYIEECYDAEQDDFVPGWGDGGEELATVKLPAGSAFWFKAPSDCAVTIAGQVLADASKEIALVGSQYSMIANPYPTAVNPNVDIEWNGLTYGDQIQVLDANGSTYSIYNYLEEAYDAELDDFVPAWGDGGEEKVVTGVIPAGQGAWIKPLANISLSFTSPL